MKRLCVLLTISSLLLSCRSGYQVNLADDGTEGSLCSESRSSLALAPAAYTPFSKKGLAVGQRLTFLFDNQCLWLANPQDSGLRPFTSQLAQMRPATAASFEVMTAIYSSNFPASLPCLKAWSASGKMELTGSLSTRGLNDPLAQEQKHLNLIGFDQVSDRLLSTVQAADKTIVGVIDTGGSLKHEDMVGQFWQNLAELNGVAGVDDDGNGFVDDVNGWNFDNENNDVEDPTTSFPHGSHTAGLVAARANNGLGVAGVASHRAKVMTVNGIATLLPGFGKDTFVVVSKGIQYAVDNGAQVINLSMGTRAPSDVVLAVLRYAVEKGVFVVASAGNNSMEIDTDHPFAPAMYAKDLPGMIAVGATNGAPGLESTLCGFSNFSSRYVEIAAPGCQQPTPAERQGILSTGLMADPELRYARMEGTSMSAPLVSAAAAVIMSYIHEKTGQWPANSLVKKIILEGSVFQADLANHISAGRVLDLPSIFRYIDAHILKSGPCGPSEAT